MKVYSKKLNDLSSGEICEEQYGDWMRALNLIATKKRMDEELGKGVSQLIIQRQENLEPNSNEEERARIEKKKPKERDQKELENNDMRDKLVRMFF